ncbi:hypothetical protein SADUNF_Sadunf05G0075900 [Salix dunnii]|uniref:Uncharacterized protein n=1 Tax=Salix dunnii TaxID=1413687 RepID=A0A835K129_9ROSI|nr:hypothetical protein SADUNF_Sadunf05G0075900 [Salix dunnii]
MKTMCNVSDRTGKQKTSRGIAALATTPLYINFDTRDHLLCFGLDDVDRNIRRDWKMEPLVTLTSLITLITADSLSTFLHKSSTPDKPLQIDPVVGDDSHALSLFSPSSTSSVVGCDLVGKLIDLTWMYCFERWLEIEMLNPTMISWALPLKGDLQIHQLGFKRNMHKRTCKEDFRLEGIGTVSLFASPFIGRTFLSKSRPQLDPETYSDKNKQIGPKR